MASIHAAALPIRRRAIVSPIEEFAAGTPDGPHEFRQLRHQTKNALQRILREIARTAEAPGNPETRAFLADLERRVRLSAVISDALFGVTAAPGPLPDRLRALCRAMVGALAAGDQVVTWSVTVAGACPACQAPTLLRVAHEMIGNALRHGFAGRSTGRIHVSLAVGKRCTRLVVSDDGNGPDAIGGVGQGMRLMEELARSRGGRVTLRRRAGFTLAELEMPRP